MATGYDIRYNLLNDAKNMLYERWNQDISNMRYNAGAANAQIADLPEPPTAAQIKALAEELYEFVQRK